MSWVDRLREAAYTAPSGVRVTFLYEDVAVDSSKKTTVFTFPAFDGASVQDLGRGARSFPLRVIFTGDDYDIAAERFLELLEEAGRGVLEHPAYGRREVVPVGTISRRDNLKTAANQAIFEITFLEDTEIQFPVSRVEPVELINAAIADYDAAQAEEFEADVKTETSSELVTFKQAARDGLRNVRRAMAPVVETVDAIRAEFEDALELIEESIDVLIDDPLQLANSIINLTRLPGQAAAGIEATLEAYGNLVNSFIGAENANFSPSLVNRNPQNTFANNNLFALAAISSMLTSSVIIAEQTADTSALTIESFIRFQEGSANSFNTKSGIINAINTINLTLNDYLSWADNNRRALSVLDTGEGYFNFNDAYSLTIGYLIFISLSAKQEIILELDRNRNFVELVGELYGIVDAAFDFFISTNDLTGDEIIELPKGRNILYYR